MYLIIRRSDLSLPSRTRGLMPLHRGFLPGLGRELMAFDREGARAFDDGKLHGCGIDGTAGPDELAGGTFAAVGLPEGAPMAGGAPPPFSPGPEAPRFAPPLEDFERQQFKRRIAALELQLEQALARREADERADRANEEALEEAEDRAFAALVELLMIARSEARALRRARRA